MDDGGAQQPAADPNAQPAAGGDDGITEPPVDTGASAEGGGTATDTAAEEPAPENDVTAAVKDKVAEATVPLPGGSFRQRHRNHERLITWRVGRGAHAPSHSYDIRSYYRLGFNVYLSHSRKEMMKRYG